MSPLRSNPGGWSKSGCGGVLVIALAMGILLLAPGGADADPCYASNDSKVLMCRFGLEVWVEGKKSSGQFEQWELTCDSAQGRASACSLERTLLVIWPERMGGPRVTVQRHSTGDGTLRLLNGKWNEGSLDFDVVLATGVRMPAQLRLRSLFDGRFFGFDSFKANVVVRSLLTGEVESQQLRVPESTYSVNLPMVLQGRRSTAEARREALLQQLGAHDRAVMERTFGTCPESGAWLKREPLRSLAQQHEARMKALEEQMQGATGKKFWDLSAQHSATAKEWFARDEVRREMIGEFKRCLGRAGMSEQGREAFGSYFLREIELDLAK